MEHPASRKIMINVNSTIKLPVKKSGQADKDRLTTKMDYSPICRERMLMLPF
jgi:hypothetical protein